MVMLYFRSIHELQKRNVSVFDWKKRFSVDYTVNTNKMLFNLFQIEISKTMSTRVYFMKQVHDYKTIEVDELILKEKYISV